MVKCLGVFLDEAKALSTLRYQAVFWWVSALLNWCVHWIFLISKMKKRQQYKNTKMLNRCFSLFMIRKWCPEVLCADKAVCFYSWQWQNSSSTRSPDSLRAYGRGSGPASWACIRSYSWQQKCIVYIPKNKKKIFWSKQSICKFRFNFIAEQRRSETWEVFKSSNQNILCETQYCIQF